jgi:hypothetical protein
MTSAWQIRRSRFNHDWLKNRYLPALGKYMNIQRELVEDDGFEHDFVQGILPQWDGQSRAARELLDTFATEMSPRTVLSKPIFRHLDEPTRQWVGLLIHELWLNRYPVGEWQARAQTALLRADQQYAALFAVFEKNPCDGKSKLLLDRVCLFFDGCLEVSRAIEQFPSGILMV